MRRVVGVSVLALALALGACGSDNVTNPVVQSSMAGTWSLVSVDGAQLPLIIAQVGEDNFQIMSDVITADSVGGFTEMITIASLVNGQLATDTIPDVGTYAVSGSSVAITYQSSGSTAMGTIAGDLLNVSDGSGGSMTYMRQ